MRSLGFVAMVIALSSPSTAQDSDRDARLRAAVARDRGDITALEPLPAGAQGVIVGYSSGAVLHCQGKDQCTEYAGTPNAAVRHLAVAGSGASIVVWAAYPQGALYRCASGRCDKFLWDTSRDR